MPRSEFAGIDIWTHATAIRENSGKFLIFQKCFFPVLALLSLYALCFLATENIIPVDFLKEATVENIWLWRRVEMNVSID